MKGWRTVAVNAVAALPVLADVLLAVTTDPAVADLIPDQWAAYYALFVVLVNLYLRTITTTPLGRRE